LGGGGRDVLNGGLGGDLIEGGPDPDYASLSRGGPVVVDLAAGTAWAGADTLDSIENLLGSRQGDDDLFGNGGDDRAAGGPHVTGDVCEA
jgi:hypothetical protein